MGLLLILPILVSGYIFCNGSVYRQATINKYEGQLLYLLVAKIGLFVFVGAAALSGLLVYLSKHAYFSGFSFDYLKYVKAFLIRNGIAGAESAPLWVFLGQASVISFILASLCPRAYVLAIRWRHSLSTDQAKAFIYNFVVPNRPITKQLLASMMDEEGQYMFSMDDRKVYVGRVSSVGEPHETAGLDEDFEIVPTMSGYRDKDTLKVAYTTDYSAVVEKMAQAGRSIGFTILLSQKNIVSMSRFEFAVWEQFKARQEADAATAALSERGQ
jgi:hypothetical protein